MSYVKLSHEHVAVDQANWLGEMCRRSERTIIQPDSYSLTVSETRVGKVSERFWKQYVGGYCPGYTTSLRLVAIEQL